jgi:hypothetical protein
MNTIDIRVSVLLLLASAAGCGTGKPTLDGTVALDGEPLATGSILLVKTDGGMAREGGVIKDGAFQVTLAPGKYRVEINARRVVGKRKVVDFGPAGEAEVTEELISERYNTKTELSVDIKHGRNTVAWKLDRKR